MAMTINQRTAATFFAAMILTCLAAAAYLLTTGVTDDSISLALRISGRFAFLILIVAFAARPLQQLLKAPWTAKLLRNRRQLGVAFAGIHTAHFGLILMRINHVPEFGAGSPFSLSGAFTYVVILAMLVTSFSGPTRALGPRAWKVLHKLGIFFLFAAFLRTQLPHSIAELELANGLLIALAGAALIVRVAAFVANRRSAPKRQPQ